MKAGAHGRYGEKQKRRSEEEKGRRRDCKNSNEKEVEF
jgi:hypothetical protein